MRHLILSLLLLVCCSSAWAQKQNVSGTVKGSDGSVPLKVSVREIDAEHRVFNHTTTDRNGLFSFRVRDAQHSLQFYAPGYRTLSHKMLGQKSFTVTMDRRRTSPYVASAKVVLKSEHLICGHYLGEVVRRQAWLEKMNDTLYAIILPVEMEKAVDEYPAGRQLIVLDELSRQVMQLENVVDVYPIAGDPDDVEVVHCTVLYGHGPHPWRKRGRVQVLRLSPLPDLQGTAREALPEPEAPGPFRRRYLQGGQLLELLPDRQDNLPLPQGNGEVKRRPGSHSTENRLTLHGESAHTPRSIGVTDVECCPLTPCPLLLAPKGINASEI